MSKTFVPVIKKTKRDDCIEAMKSYVGDVVIHGKGIKNKNGQYRKIKISSVEIHQQTKLFKDTN